MTNLHNYRVRFSSLQQNKQNKCRKCEEAQFAQFAVIGLGVIK